MIFDIEIGIEGKQFESIKAFQTQRSVLCEPLRFLRFPSKFETQSPRWFTKGAMDRFNEEILAVPFPSPHPNPVPSMGISGCWTWTTGAGHVIHLPPTPRDRQRIYRPATIRNTCDPMPCAAFEERMVAHGVVSLIAQTSILCSGKHACMPCQCRKTTAETQTIPRSCAEGRKRTCM